MKHFYVYSTVFIIFLIHFTFAQIPQTISYQGLLTDNAGVTAPDKNYELSFKIYNQETEGTALWEETQSVNVIDGVFNVVLGNNNPLALSFDEKYWLGTTISPESELVPRVELTASPYSLNARQVKGTNILPSEGNVGIGTTNPEASLDVKGRTFRLGEAAFQDGSLSGVPIISSDGINTDLMPPQDDVGKVRIKDGNGTGALTIENFGTSVINSYHDVNSSTHSDIILQNLGGNVGIGTELPQEKLEVAGTVYSTSGGFKFPDGSVQASAATGSGGIGDGDITSVNAGNGLTGGATAGDATLNVGAGTGITVTANEVALNSAYTDNRYVQGGGTAGRISKFASNSSIENSNIYSDNDNIGIGMVPDGTRFGVRYVSTKGVETPAYLARFQTETGFTVTDQAYIKNNGESFFRGIGFPGNFGPGEYVGTPGNYLAFGHIGFSEDYIGYRDHTFYFRDSPGGGDISEPNVDIGGVLLVRGGSMGKSAEFWGNVLVRTKGGSPVVELGEGLDYAEGFDISDLEDLNPGTVVVIDPKNPGKLKISSESYDSKVAGIVAGANGLGSGVRLGVDEFDCDIALAGRVYCNADASNDDIKPGDLLTTSSNAGFAMKALDAERRAGAILGKAMESLPKGQKGKILVLVTLQ